MGEAMNEDTLEMAALAAGYQLEWRREYETLVQLNGETRRIERSKDAYIWGDEWRPSIDDGDALRLAVDVKIGLTFGEWDVSANVRNKKGEVLHFSWPCSPLEMSHAVRRIILMAAATVGRSMIEKCEVVAYKQK